MGVVIHISVFLEFKPIAKPSRVPERLIAGNFGDLDMKPVAFGC
jgi:hypothetical protein